MWTSDPVWDAECYAAEQDRLGRSPAAGGGDKGD